MNSNKRKILGEKQARGLAKGGLPLAKWIEEGNDVNSQTSDGYTILELGIKTFITEETVAILLANGAEANGTIPPIGSRFIPMVMMCYQVDQRIIKMLIDFGMDVHASTSTFNLSVLHFLARTKPPVNLQFFIDQKVDINKQDSDDGSTPLHWAVNAANESAVKILVENKADINIRRKALGGKMETALDIAKKI